MSEFKFQGQSFQMEDSARDFLEKYISRIKKYAEKHEISDDLIEDIYQSILEKLFEVKGDITQKKLLKIVNSIGEPEDIFDEESNLYQVSQETQNSDIDSDSLYFYEKLQKTKRNRPQDGAILLGVCKMFGQATGRNTRIWRCLAIFGSRLFLEAEFYRLFIFGRLCYLLLALIFPIKDKDYKHKNLIKYFITQIFDIRLVVSNSVVRFFGFCGRIVKTAIPSVIRFLSKLFGPIWTFVKYVFLICRSLFLLFTIVSLGVILYYSITGFILGNIDYSSLIPNITKRGIGLGIISAFLLLLSSIGAIFKKKLSNNISLIIAIGCGILAFIIAIISMIDVKNKLGINNFMDYDYQFSKDIEVEILDTENTVDIFVDSLVDYFDKIVVDDSNVVNLYPSDDDKIKVEYRFTFRSDSQDLVKQATDNLSDLEYDFNGNTLYVALKNHELFSKITPAVRVDIDYFIYIPKDLKFNLINKRYPAGITVPSRAESMQGYHDCTYIKYSEETQEFYCELTLNRSERYNIARKNLQEIADDVVPLRGTNSVWSQNHYGDNLYQQYWRLDSINVYNSESLLAKFSDTFFNFFIYIEYTINEETGEFKIKDVVLQQVEQKGLMDSERMKHYIGWEDISDFDIQMREDEEEKIQKEQDIQSLSGRLSTLEEKINTLTKLLNVSNS